MTFLLSQGDNPLIVDSKNEDTALHLAADEGNAATVKALLELEVSSDLLNKTNGHKKTPLLVAGSSGNFEVIDFLCKHGPDLDINAIDDEGETILHKVTDAAAANTVKWLLNQDPDIRPNSDRRTPLHIACYNNDEGFIEEFLDHLSSKVISRSQAIKILATQDRWGDTALSDCVDNGNTSIVFWLLQHGFYFPRDPTACDVDDLYISCKEEVEKLGPFLLSWLRDLEDILDTNLGRTTSQGPDPRAGGYSQNLRAVCYWAVLNGNLQLVSHCVYVLQKNNITFDKEGNGVTWLHLFALRRSLPNEWRPTWQFLCEADKGENSQSQDSQGNTPLSLMIRNPNPSVQMVEHILPDFKQVDSILQQRKTQGRGFLENNTIGFAASGLKTAHREIEKLLWGRIVAVSKEQRVFSQENWSDSSDLILELAARFLHPKDEHILRGFLQEVLEGKGESHNGKKALELAVQLLYPKVVFWLLSNGEHYDQRTLNDGLAALPPPPETEEGMRVKRMIEEMLNDPPPFISHFGRWDDHLFPHIDSESNEFDAFPKGAIVDLSDQCANFRFKACLMSEIINSTGPEELMGSGRDYDQLFPAESGEQASEGPREEPEHIRQDLKEQDPKEISEVSSNSHFSRCYFNRKPALLCCEKSCTNQKTTQRRKLRESHRQSSEA